MRQERIDASQMELVEKVVSIKRVTKVVKGGRNFRFTALVVVGDGNGHVGAGLGKATEIPEAIRKGKEDAMKKMISVSLDENSSVTHDVIGKFGSASVLLKKAPEGTGVIAGGPARAVIEAAGVEMANLKVTLVKSTIGAVPKHRKTVEALGLKKLNKTVVLPDNAATRGMVQQVRHLVKVEEEA